MESIKKKTSIGINLSRISKKNEEKEIKLDQRWIRFASGLKVKRNMTCDLCLTQYEKKRQLVCHHIVSMKIIKHNIELIFDENNIQVLCHDCHNGIHGQPGMLTEYMQTPSYVMVTLRKIGKQLCKAISKN